jgi:hypothetical protein
LADFDEVVIIEMFELWEIDKACFVENPLFKGVSWVPKTGLEPVRPGRAEGF